MAESRWGKPGFEQPFSIPNDLRRTVSKFSIATRQKIYAYIQRGGIFNYASWDGCVMNAASGGQVRSHQAAAEYFGELEYDVTNFIIAWDRFAAISPSRETATRTLKTILERTGLVEASPKEVSTAKIYRVRIFTSKETKMVEELRAEIEAGAFDNIVEEMKELCFV